MFCASEAAWTWWRLYLIPGRDTVLTVSIAAWFLSRYIRELAMGTWSLVLFSNTYGTSCMVHSPTWGKESDNCAHRARFTISLRQCKPSFGVKKLLSGFTKHTVGNWHWKAWTVYFCDSPYWICICRSFPFDQYIYGRRVFKWITQRNLIRFTLVNSLVFVALFNAQKKHALKQVVICAAQVK